MGFKLLGLDASGPSLAVGLLDDGRVVADRMWLKPKTAGAVLVAWVDELVRQFGAPDGIAVGIGPGSYTGVRVAVTAAKAYALAWDIPVAGVSSLRAWAWGVCPPARVVVSSERRGDAFYLGYYWRGANGVEPLMDDAAVNGPLPDLFPVAEPVVVLGPIADDPQLMAAVGPRAQPGQAILSGAQVAWAAWPGVQWGQSQDPLTLAPLYLRPPTASNPSR